MGWSAYVIHLGYCAHEEHPLGQRRRLLVRHYHVRRAALADGAEVHVHERLALVGPASDLYHLVLVRVAHQVLHRVDQLLVDKVLQLPCEKIILLKLHQFAHYPY